MEARRMKNPLLILTLLVLSFFGGAWIDPASWNTQRLKGTLRTWLAEASVDPPSAVEGEDSAKPRRRDVPAAPIPALVFESERSRFRSQTNSTGQIATANEVEVNEPAHDEASPTFDDPAGPLAFRNPSLNELETGRPEPPPARAPTGPLARPDRNHRDRDSAVTRTGGTVVLPDLPDLEHDARDTIGTPQPSSSQNELTASQSLASTTSSHPTTPSPNSAAKPPTPDPDLKHALHLPAGVDPSRLQPHSASYDPDSHPAQRDPWTDAVARLHTLGVTRFGVEARLDDPRTTTNNHDDQSRNTANAATSVAPTIIAWAICPETEADGQPIRLEARDDTLQSALESLARKLTLRKVARLADLDAP
jgi:hypothetical protein